jgi:hypothetical protein
MDIHDFDPSKLTTDNEGKIPRSVYATLSPMEKVLAAAQEGFCREHGFVSPTSYNKAVELKSGDSLLDHLVIELIEGCDGEDDNPDLVEIAISKLEASIDLLYAAIEGIRSLVDLHGKLETPGEGSSS